MGWLPGTSHQARPGRCRSPREISRTSPASFRVSRAPRRRSRRPPSFSTARFWRSIPRADRLFRLFITPPPEGLSIVYYAFDLLHLNGRDLTRMPLDERRASLRDVVQGIRPSAVRAAAWNRCADRRRRARSRPGRGGRETQAVNIHCRPQERCVGQGALRSAPGIGDWWLQAERGGIRLTRCRLLRGTPIDVRRKSPKRLHAAPARSGVRAHSKSCSFTLPVREPAIDEDRALGRWDHR